MSSAQPVSSAARPGGGGVSFPPATPAANPIPQSGPALAPAAASVRGGSACSPDGSASAGGSSPCPLFSRSDDAQLAPSARPAREGSLSKQRRRTDAEFIATVRPIMEAGGRWKDAAAALGMTVRATQLRGLRFGIASLHGPGFPRGVSTEKSRAAAQRNIRIANAVRLAALGCGRLKSAGAAAAPPVPLPGGARNKLYRKLRRAGVPREAAIAECMR